MFRKSLVFCLACMLLIPMAIGGGQARAKENTNENSFGINPTPQHLKVIGKGFPLTPKVGLVVGDDTDQSAIKVVEQTLKEAGVNKIIKKKANEASPHTPVTIWLGSFSDNPKAKKALKSVTSGKEDLKKEGYLLASGIGNKDNKGIVLAGKDKAGTFYAAKTFDQLIQKRTGRDLVPSVVVADWPDMPIRGSIEGFYGPPWSHEDRLRQLEFYGDNKMNTYIYAPKDDPYHRAKWREPYPQDRLDDLKELVDKAKENHVKLTFSLSPGNTVCYSGDKDFELLMNKMQAVWDLGVRSYAIFLDDISYNFHCDQDKAMFGDDPNPTAAGQAYLLNRFNKEFIQTHKGADRLITVPTGYAGNDSTVYRERFADLLNQDTIVMWTGPAVVPENVTSEGAEKVSQIFKHDLLLWDNYPVNDYDRNRLFLGPLVKRDADLTEHGVLGVTANPMNEAEASKIPLYTIADYTWNPHHYDPKDSWERSIQSFGGDAAEALKDFAENSYSSPINSKESLTLTPLIKAFLTAYKTDEADQAAQNLIAEFEHLQTVPGSLRNKMDNDQFLQEVDPYLNKLEIYSKAGVAAVKALMAKKVDDSDRADHYKEKVKTLMKESDAISQKVGEYVIRPFLVKAVYGETVVSRPLDGVNKARGAGELIQYTPEQGDTTGTNIYGYEVTVVDGKVVKRGGNNSPIPENGYVLSIHGSDWLKDNALLGAKVEINDGQVLITK
ncbi:beta-N-acetylhexosaminidase family protein [Scopulibacillus darangshiensis]|uniref:beta-N-acetylhexosaminidase family protein n=1 Tax=Scopulibacillus darangshiensis TaxID=442528 RepID=UPI001FB1C506|nr:beta-N-acetylglucosaminidase domain-containing protein [Scopulibacillus darangshiensis]